MNGATCEFDVDNIMNFTCVCVYPWTGIFCGEELPTGCDQDLCVNGATCEFDAANRDDFTCTCMDGWTGEFCEQDIDYCASNPCPTFPINQTCRDNGGMPGYECLCPSGKPATDSGECNLYPELANFLIDNYDQKNVYLGFIFDKLTGADLKEVCIYKQQ